MLPSSGIKPTRSICGMCVFTTEATFLFYSLPFTGNIVQTCPLSIDGGVEVSGTLDGNLGDDDGDTWSQNDDEPYLYDT